MKRRLFAFFLAMLMVSQMVLPAAAETVAVNQGTAETGEQPPRQEEAEQAPEEPDEPQPTVTEEPTLPEQEQEEQQPSEPECTEPETPLPDFSEPEHSEVPEETSRPSEPTEPSEKPEEPEEIKTEETELEDELFTEESTISCVVEDGVLTISGTGELTADLLGENVADWENKEFDSIVIQPGIVAIADEVFRYWSIISVEIPSTVETIGAYAFESTDLEELNIPASVTHLGEGAFSNCGCLQSVTLPKGLISIGDYAFMSTSLEELTIPASVTYLGEGVCYECKSLQSVTLPEGLISVGANSFSCTALKTITLPGSLQNIGYGAFRYCTALEEVYFPSGLKTIGEEAFEGCENLEEVELPTSLVSLGDYPFGAATIYYSGTFGQWKQIDGWQNHMNLVRFSDGVEYDNRILTGTFGEGFTWQLDFDDEDACLRVYGTGEMTFQDGKVPWADCKEEILACSLENDITSLPANAFSGCENLTEAYLPDNLKIIGREAFADTSLTEIELPESLISIGAYAFRGTDLRTVRIPDQATSIQTGVFMNCEELVSITLPDPEYSWDFNVSVYDNLKYIPDYTFFGCKKLTQIVLPGSVRHIGESAFEGCSSLTDLDQNYSGSIGKRAFAGCTSLESMDITFCGMYYGQNSYWKCTLGEQAFENCSGLKTVVIDIYSDTVLSIQPNAFAGCSSLQQVELPDELQTIGAGTFRNCISLTTLQLPEQLQEIPDDLFFGCTGLESITISKLVSSIGNAAFSGCEALRDVFYQGDEADWEALLIGDNNQPFRAARLHTCVLSGTCGDNLTWEVDGNVLTIRGTGPMQDYGYQDGESLACVVRSSQSPWQDMEIRQVILEPGITSIGNAAFALCYELRSVTIPDTVTRIGDAAFNSCFELWSVNIPNSVTYIGQKAFTACHALRTISVPAGVKEIGFAAFSYGRATSLILHSGTTTIGESAFAYNFPYGGSISLPAGLTTIRENAFLGCSDALQVAYKGNQAQREKISIASGNESLVNASWQVGVPTVYSGSCGANAKWKLEDGVLTISGKGAMENYSFDTEEIPWMAVASDVEQIDTVVVGQGITRIGDHAFQGLNIKSLSIANTVTEIGSYAFYGVTLPESIHLPNKLKKIEDGAFEFSRNGCYVDLPATLEYIGDRAFYFSDVKNILIPAKVTKLGDSCFNGCIDLETVQLPAGLKEIGGNAFYGCEKLTKLVLPAGLTRIGYSAFEKCENLQSVTLPKNASALDATVFDGCNNLKELVFPGTRKEWEEISRETGWGESRLRDMPVRCTDGDYICQDEITWKVENGVLTISGSGAMPEYDQQTGDIYKPWQQYKNEVHTIVISSGITSIGQEAFMYFKNLTHVNIGDDVKKIGYRAFYGCSNLEDVHLGKSIVHLGIGAFENSGLGSIVIPEGVTYIPYNTFSNCKSLHTVYLPESLTSICKEAFYSSGLEELIIPDAVTEIGMSAFSYCKNLKTIRLPDNLEIIGQDAFNGCKQLKQVFIPIGVTEIEGGAFAHSGLESIEIPEGITYVASYLCWDCQSLTSVSLPSTLIEIGWGAFESCTNLREITIPEGVQEIGSSAFKGTGLEMLEIPDGVQTIEHWTFRECERLTSIVLPNTITKIDWGAFEGCERLTDVYYQGSKSDWRFIEIDADAGLENARIHCMKMDESGTCGENLRWRLKDGLLTISGTGAMEDWEDSLWLDAGVRQLVVEEGVTVIGAHAFDGCDELETVTLPSTLQIVGENAFASCDNLWMVIFNGSGVQWEETLEIMDGNDDLIYADLLIREYYLYYENVEDSDNPNPYFCKYDVALTLKAPKRTGYIFGGWYNNEELTGKAITSIPKTNREDIILYAKWTPVSYTLTFNGNGSKSGKLASITMVYDEEIELPENVFARTGYYFAGWNTAKNGTGEAYEECEYVKNLLDKKGTITLYAQWQPHTYTIYFEPNCTNVWGGEMDVLVAAYDENAVLPDCGYNQVGAVFTGWNTRSDGRGKTYKPGAKVKNLATGEYEDEYVCLYAMWTAAKYTVAFDPNGGSGKVKTQTMTCGKTAKLAANTFKRTGYIFDGWSYDPEAEYEDFWDKDMVSDLLDYPGTVTLYALWRPIYYKLTLLPNGGTDEQETEWHSYEDTFELPMDWSRPGYRFLGWGTSKSGKVNYAPGQDVSGLATQDEKEVKLYAQWAAHIYSIHFEGNGAQSGKMKDMTRLSCGKTYTLTANAFKRPGYTFLGWSTEENGNVVYANKYKGTDFSLVDGDTITLYAQWRPNRYTLTLNTNGAAFTLESMTCDYNETYTLPGTQEMVRPGHDFLGWSTSKTGKIVYTPGESITNLSNQDGKKLTLYAQWRAYTYEIHYHGNGETSGKMRDMTKLSCGKSYVLTANSFKRTGYTFSGWAMEENGGVVYANRQKVTDLSITDGGKVDLYAVWTPVEYKITYRNVISLETGELAKTFNIRDGLLLEAPAERPGMTFEGWYLDSKFKTEVTQLPVEDARGQVKAAAITLYAKWTGAAHKYTIHLDGNGATSGKMADQKGKVNGKEYTLPNCAFKRTGYTFLGWALEADATEAVFANREKIANLAQQENEVVTLYAVWKANS